VGLAYRHVSDRDDLRPSRRQTGCWRVQNDGMWRTRRISFVAFLVVAAAACGSDTQEAVVNAAPTVPAATAAPTTSTTLAPTTTTLVETTTTAAPTTLAPTTTTIVETTTSLAPALPAEAPPAVEDLPVPVAPPPARADEPVIELGTLEIPSIGVSKTMFEGITLNTLDRGPGHWPGTAGPGDFGNMVIGGHRTSHDRPFYDLDKLAVGDQIVVSNLAGRHVYSITESLVVTPDAVWIVDQTPEKILTLFACHPKGSTRQRIVIRAAFVETQPL
jgi:sortase A